VKTLQTATTEQMVEPSILKSEMAPVVGIERPVPRET